MLALGSPKCFVLGVASAWAVAAVIFLVKRKAPHSAGDERRWLLSAEVASRSERSDAVMCCAG